MASTYSTLKVELIGTGDQTGTWGTTTNDNLSVALGEAITGSADVAFSSADVTVTLTDTNAAQTARNLRLNLTGTSGGARNLILGSGCQIEKLYLINNGLADAVTVKNTSGTGIAVAAGKSMFVYNNGTNVVDAVTHLSSLTLGTALPVASGGTGSTSTTFVNLASNVTGTLPIANGGTGTSSTTFANLATNVTGTLPVANGGTGTANPGLVQGSGITISGSWPNQTVASSGGGGGISGLEVFNSSGTFTTSASTTKVYIVCIGGGGGSGGASNEPFSSGAGGSGAVGVGVFTVTPSTGYSVTVGGGGPRGNFGNNAGNAGSSGGASSFSSFITCNGGGGGNGSNNNNGDGNQGGSGNATGATASTLASVYLGSGPLPTGANIGVSSNAGAMGSRVSGSPSNGIAGSGGTVLVYF